MFNLPVQANDADGFKVALLKISEKLGNLDARIIHTQHDEIIVEARAEIAEAVRGIMRECIQAAFKQIIPEVLFVAEPRVAETWR